MPNVRTPRETKVARTASVEPEEIAREVLTVPRLGVSRLQDDPLRAVRSVNASSLPHESTRRRSRFRRRQRAGPLRASSGTLSIRRTFDEVHRRIDVRAGVHPHGFP